MTTIITKNSSTASAVPAAGSLVQGELAVNVTDKKLYTKDSGGTVQKIVGSLGNQEASAVAITGGSITGITDLAIADGGTGASTASDARTNLGLGSIATQNSNSVSITGGSITGITDLAIADGGTGASDAATARTNLGLGSISTQAANSVAITGGSITGITDLAIADGGTGASTANDALNNLLPSQASASGKYLKSDGTNASWDQLDISTADITGTLPVLNGGTGATTASGARTNLGVTATGSDTTYAYRANNLSDLASASTARTNLGLGSIATQAASSVAITGGSIDGTAIGGTTAAAGAFTTLAASGAVTLSGGTANGVAYLNGSKVLTTGSALTFDGTNLGVGVASPTLRIQAAVSGATTTFDGLGVTNGTATYRLGLTGASYSYAGAGANEVWLYSSSTTPLTLGPDGNGPIKFVTNGSEQMRLTSTGLGIGTSSPGAKLDVSASSGSYAQLSGKSSAAVSADLRITRTSSSTGVVAAPNIYFSDGAAGNVNDFAIQVGSGNLQFWNYSASSWVERMRLDSSGNLGLGVTPSAWNTVTALQIRNASLYGYSTDESGWQQNAYYASGWKYISTGNAASQYMQVSGTHRWYTAPSGTAGNAISFSQAMTLDASGRWMQGTTTPLGAMTSTNASGYIGFSTYTSGGSISEHSYTNTAGLQIDSYQSASGSPYTKTTDIVANADSGASAQMRFFTTSAGSAPAERARIDSSGNLLVGTTSSGSWASGGILVSPNYDRTLSSALAIGHVSTAASGDRYMNFGYNGSSIGSITQNGTTAVAYNTSSDYRLKNIDGPLTGSGEFIDALKPKVGTWKADGSKFVGFLAHEVQEVSPSSVVGTKDAVDEEGKPIMQAMEYGSAEFIANIVAELQSLRARVAQLESKGA